MGKLRGSWGINRQATDGAFFYSAKKINEPFEIHRFLEDVLHDLVDEWVIGNLDVTDNRFEAGSSLREDRGHEIFRASALNLWGYAFAF